MKVKQNISTNPSDFPHQQHLPGITEHKGHLLVNSGHCLGEFLHFVSINTHQSLVRVYRVQQSQTEPMNENNFDIIDQVALPQAMNRAGL